MASRRLGTVDSELDTLRSPPLEVFVHGSLLGSELFFTSSLVKLLATVGITEVVVIEHTRFSRVNAFEPRSFMNSDDGKAYVVFPISRTETIVKTG